MGQLDGKTAIVTGGTSGIGLATAQRFAAEGAHVFVTGRRKDALDAAVARIGPNATGVRGDVSDLADLDRLYDAVAQQGRRIDVLFANAGGGEFATLEQVTERALRRDVRHQRQGHAVHRAEGAAAAQRRRLDHPRGLHRGHRRQRGVRRLRGLQGRGAVLRPHLGRRAQGPRDPGQRHQPRHDRHARDRRPGPDQEQAAQLKASGQQIPLGRIGPPRGGRRRRRSSSPRTRAASSPASSSSSTAAPTRSDRPGPEGGAGRR